MDDHHQIQLEIPNFLYSSAPTLVPGGGAEIVPADWFVNNSYAGPAYDTLQDEDENTSSSAAPFEFTESIPLSFPAEQVPLQPDLSLLTSLAAPSSIGLPIYSASGFDLLSIFARISNRPNPRVVLGPVDLTCSFVVVDVRRFDHPIVYCSPTFCTLTGYSENEVLHRNCRFLQAPNGQVQKGQPRPFSTEAAVAHLRKSLMADKECQTSIVNYKKNGAAFVNLVTVIPVPGEDNEIAYHVGFQVDLGEQPNAILDKLRDGSYIINYAAQLQNINNKPRSASLIAHNNQNQQQNPTNFNSRDRKANSIPPITLSKELKRVLADPTFLSSFPNPTTTNSSSAADELTTASAGNTNNHNLHLFLLEAAPDFIHVVSLKGSFLYVAPSVRRVLGYEAHELIGKSLLDYAHPDDIVPLMRELKESSSTGVCAGTGVSASTALTALTSLTLTGATTAGSGSGNRAASVSHTPPPPAAPPPGGINNSGNNGGMLLPRPVDLLFRAKTKMGRYVWVECRGRLHVEPGKGRKAIILTGRAREMMNLKWEDVKRAGGLAKTKRMSSTSKEPQEMEQEVWGMVGGSGKETATFLSVGHGVKDVLGWRAEDLVGSAVMDIVHGENAKNIVGGYVQTMRQYQQRQRRRSSPFSRHTTLSSSMDGAAKFNKFRCSVCRKDGTLVDVWFVLYRADPDQTDNEEDHKMRIVNEGKGMGMSTSPAPLVYQIRLVEAETLACGPDPGVSSMLNMTATGSAAARPIGSSALSPSSSTTPSTISSPPGIGYSGSSLDSSLQEQQVLPQHPSYDIFDELSVRRHTSWQYELQHLVNTNANLERQIQELEKAEAAALKVNLAGVSSSLSGAYEPTVAASSAVGYHYENPPVDVLRMHQHQGQQQQLFSRQPLSLPSYPALLEPLGPVSANNNNNNTTGEDAASPSHHIATSMSAYLHHPQPKFLAQHTIAMRERGVSSPPPSLPPPGAQKHAYLESEGLIQPQHWAHYGHDNREQVYDYEYEGQQHHRQYHNDPREQQRQHHRHRQPQSNANTWGTMPIPPLSVALSLQSHLPQSPPPPRTPLSAAPMLTTGSKAMKRPWAAVD